MGVRPARTEDAGHLAVVHVESWRRAYRGQIPEAFLAGLDLAERESWFRSRIEAGSGLLVAEVDDEPVGYCYFGESSEPGWGEVHAIYVHPDHWGEGHGRSLLSSAESELAGSGLEGALLWVLAANDRARSFYRSQGWEPGRPIRIEEIGGVQVTEVRYEHHFRAGSRAGPGPRGR